MKKLVLLVVLTLTFMSCENNDSNEFPESFSIEGKWLLTNAGGSEFLPNTMYEFQNGLKYTYYCVDGASCDWAGMTTNGAIPSQPSYTFVDNILTIDDDMLYEIEFNCDGNLIKIQFTDSTWIWWRIGTNPNNCN